MRRFAKLIRDVSPLLIGHKADVSIIDDDGVAFRGCSRWHKKGEYMFEINLAYHDPSNWQENYYLLIYEMAHHKLKSNDHLAHIFYKSVNHLSAALTRLALKSPKLFAGTGQTASIANLRTMLETAFEEEVGDEVSEEIAA
jgi:hypothetical protein